MVRHLRWITSTVIVAALLAGGSVAFAQGRGPGGRPGPGGRGFNAGFALGQLDLSDIQRQQVRDIRQRHRDQLRQAAQRLRNAMDVQRAAVNTIPVNEGLIRSTSQELAAAQTEMALEQARLQTEIFAMLTPEQQEKARKLRADRAARMEDRQNRTQQRR